MEVTIRAVITLLNLLMCVVVVFRSSLLAVALDDFEIHVVDIDMRRIVRIFRGHTNRITDMVSGVSKDKACEVNN